MHLIDVPIDAPDYALYGILIFLYVSFSKYIQISIKNEKLLKLEKLTNETLEQKVADQVKELVSLANQDTLTTLCNRRYFMSTLNECIRSISPNQTLALMMLDMDRFKTINDSFGHDAGDKVLIEFANRIAEWNRFGATIARLGGDEFGFIFVGSFAPEDISYFCGEIIRICNEPIMIGGNTVDLTASIGVSILSNESADAKTLMKNADIAMYQAKAQGYNRYQLFDPVFGADTINSSKIELLLRQVDMEKEFELYYQPQFSLPYKELVGAEALIRWKSSSNGYIPPNAFIPVAEKIEHIAKIGKWVLKESVRQAVIWNEKLEQPIKIGINISPRQLNDDTFLDILRMLIKETGVDAAWLDVEITENTMIRQTDKIHWVFEMLKGLGVSVSIDDFGSGYSAMGYLNKYPFDRIKLDKSLIDNTVAYSISGVSIVKSIIDMSKSLGIRTIAEGVETEEQLDVLVNLGCDQVQGYLLGRPVPATDFERLFLKGKSAQSLAV
jgi:diguanylate cyclase (GGDEF)-like protein